VLQLTEALELSDVVLGRLLVAVPQLEVLGLQVRGRGRVVW
jgi:hypothetical protein